MRIGLVDIDGKHFPNLALMKISAYHKAKGDSVEFAQLKQYDILYQSKVFTFTKDMKSIFVRAEQVIKGGTGYHLFESLPDSIEHMLPDYSLYSTEHAYGFLTRGCIRKCDWCIVPKKEGLLKAHSDINEFIGNKKSAIIMDNNILASNHGLSQIEKIIDLNIKVDFNQGLDARIIANNVDIAKLLSKVKWLSPLRLACDTSEQLPIVEKAIYLLRKEKVKPSQYFVYALIRDLEEGLKRITYLKSLKVDPFAQPYIDFENGKVDRRLKQFARWVNIKQFRNISWNDYRYGANYR